MGSMASQITSLKIVYSTVYSAVDQRKHQSSASLAFVREFTGGRWIPCTKGQYAENISIWWRHHDFGESWPYPNDTALHIAISVIGSWNLVAFSRVLRHEKGSNWFNNILARRTLPSPIHKRGMAVSPIWSNYPHSLYSLRPSDVIWRQRSGSTLAQGMACCLMAPGHYLNQCGLIISEVQWHSIRIRAIPQEIPQPSITKVRLKISCLKFYWFR